jgi:DNA mismatch repair protein MutS
MSAQMESMFKQYLAWYQGHRAKYGPNTAVLMQVGKFFEIYDRLNLSTNTTNTNIREIADLCSLNLSENRDPSDDNLIKLCGGFPEPSLPKFEKQLLDAGYTVVIVVQRKNTKGDVEERCVERICSPGVYENRYNTLGRIPDTTDSCLIGLLLEPNGPANFYIGVSAIDIQTGNTWSTESQMPFLQNLPNIDNIEPFFMMHPPAEVVCWWIGPSSQAPVEATIRTWFRFPKSTVIHIRAEKPAKPSAEFIRNSFSMKTNLQPHIVLGLERYNQAYRCLGSTLNFVEEHIPSLLKKLRNNTVWIPESRVRLGNAALEQLNIVSGSSECLLFWLQKTFTSLGRRSLRERILCPIANIDELTTRFKRIDFLRPIIGDSSIEKALRSIYDLSRLHRKLHLTTLNYTDLHHLLLTYGATAELIGKFSASPISIDQEEKIQDWFQKRQRPWSVQRILSADVNSLDRTHPWAKEIYPELDMFEQQWSDLMTEVKGWAAATGEASAPINIVPSEIYPFEFVTTRKRFEKLAGKGLQFHAPTSKSSGGTLESKEISQFQKRALTLKKQWTAKQDTIWIECLEQWSASCEEIVTNTPISEFVTNWIGNLDAEFALARCAKEYDLVTPNFVNHTKSSVQIVGLRHPIIERIHTLSPYVKHDITLGQNTEAVGGAESGLLIYGTNASGKSSLMKALGIAVLCAQTGIPVAASTMNLSPYTGIFTRILGNDNLWASLSSFAVEMTEFRAILKYANEHSLILGDELCSGTETRSATAIVSAGIQILVKRGAQFLFATHLHEISETEEIRKLTAVKFAHLGVEYNSANKQIVYRRTLEAGPGSSLYGLEVCYGLDMDPEFLEFANVSRQHAQSRYNSAVEVRKCEICGSQKDMETHHIQHQHTAENGFVEAGTHVHRASNLTVLCGLCHNQHHAGKLVIKGWVSTSVGRTLEWYKSDTPAPSKTEPLDEPIKSLIRKMLSKKAKEKDIVCALNIELGRVVKITELRKWKKMLV